MLRGDFLQHGVLFFRKADGSADAALLNAGVLPFSLYRHSMYPQSRPPCYTKVVNSDASKRLADCAGLRLLDGGIRPGMHKFAQAALHVLRVLDFALPQLKH